MPVAFSSRILRTQLHLAEAFSPSFYKEIDILSQEAALEGQIKTFRLREGLELAIFDLCAQKDYSEKFSACPQLVISFLTRGIASGAFWHPVTSSTASLLEYEGGNIIVMCNKLPVETTFSLKKRQKLSGIELRVSFELLEKLSPAFLATALTHYPPLQMMEKSAGWVAKLSYSWPICSAARMVEIAASNKRQSLKLEGASLCFLDEILEIFEADREKILWRQMGRYESSLRKAIALLNDNISDPWTIKILAQKVGLSERRLKSEFRKHYHIGPYGFLQKLRLDHSKELLMAKKISVTEAALQVGYSNSSHFSKLFKRQFGVSPSQLPV